MTPDETIPDETQASRAYRIESWDDGVRAGVLVMVEDLGSVPVWALLLDRSTDDLTFATGFFDPATHPDVVSAPAMMILAALHAEPADKRAYELFGLHRDKALLAREITAVLVAARREVLKGTPRRRPLRKHIEPHQMHWDWSTKKDWGYGAPWFLGYAVNDVPTPASPECHLPEWDYDRPARAVELQRDPAAFGAALAKAMEGIQGHYLSHGGVFEVLAVRHWNQRTHAFYAAPGKRGARRLQAARLYPVFAPFMAQDEQAAGLIDQGLPFEERLADFCSEWIRDGQGRFPMGSLRRLRAYPKDRNLQTLSHHIETVSRLPTDWLPRDPEGWSHFQTGMYDPSHLADDLNVDLADLVRPYGHDWKALKDLADRHHQHDPEAAHVFGAAYLARDVMERLAATLILPVMLSLTVVRGHALPDQDDGEAEASWVFSAEAVAGRLLYLGKTIPGVIKLSKAWHAGLPRLESLLPRQRGMPSWPALTAPFTASNGLRIVALTDDASLEEEGTSLDHCVGGYGHRCRRGLSHILSVRQASEAGGEVSLSTAEIVREDGGLPGASMLKLSQHRGRQNAEPPALAQAALDEFLEALSTGATALDPEAQRLREWHWAKGLYDWRDPDNLDRAMRAWAPYLPRHAAKAGVAGIRDLVLPVVEDLATCPAGEPGLEAAA